MAFLASSNRQPKASAAPKEENDVMRIMLLNGVFMDSSFAA